MPRSIEEILEQGDESPPDEAHGRGETVDAAVLRAVRSAFLARAEAERRLADAVPVVGAEGHSWAVLGAMVGTSGEAARQRYVPRRPNADPRPRSRDIRKYRPVRAGDAS